jgi:SAM-dependent methyltransferase
MADYTLVISEVELARYRMMAERALEYEVDEMRVAGIGPGLTIADVGCGPAAMSVELARMVGPGGRVIAVERDPAARATAEQVIAAAGVTNVDLRAGDAAATGIEPGSVDVAMMRHVLAHNGGHEQAIVNHLASIVRPGGFVYLVDVDLTGIRITDVDPDLADLNTKYAEFHTRRGNDVLVGLRLRQFLTTAGLDVRTYVGHYNIVTAPPGMRPPAMAARDAMLADGIVTEADLARWDAAFARADATDVRPTIFAPSFVAIGQRP